MYLVATTTNKSMATDSKTLGNAAGDALLRLVDETHERGGSLAALAALAFAVCAWRTAYPEDDDEEEPELTAEFELSEAQMLEAQIQDAMAEASAAHV